MHRVVILKDQRVIEMRPIAADDVERSLTFFKSLSEEERRYLRRDVTRREVIEQRLGEALQKKVDRIVALYEGRIVADGSLEPERFQWADGVAEIRIIVAPDFRHAGLGLRVVRELYALAHQRGVARINARVMAPQAAARAIFHSLGFKEEFVIPNHVKDRDGRWQDLIVMHCDLAVLMSVPAEGARMGDADTPHPGGDQIVAEIDVLKKYALRWAILAAWNDDLDRRNVATSSACARRMEESRVKIASGCFGSCHIGNVLSEVEAELVSVDGSTDESKASTWIDLLGKAMDNPDSALGLTAVKFRYSDCLAGSCICGEIK